MISYYELLGMIKEGKAPNKIRVHLTSEPKIYVKDDDIDEYCYYILDSKEKEDENYKDYLMDSFIESMMFDENIEILDEKKIEKLNLGNATINEQQLEFKINEIINYLESKGV